MLKIYNDLEYAVCIKIDMANSKVKVEINVQDTSAKLVENSIKIY